MSTSRSTSQPDDSPALTARAGVTIKNVRDDESDPNWHLFSSAIKDVPMGIEYHTGEDESYHSPGLDEFHIEPEDYTSLGDNQDRYSQNIPNKKYHHQAVWENRTYWDPPKTTWYQSDIPTSDNGVSYNADGSKIGYFPTNTPYGTWRNESYKHENNQNGNGDVGFFDLYAYSEHFYHWINFKREGSSLASGFQDHWHWDKETGNDKHYRIDYKYFVPKDNSSDEIETKPGNEPTFLNGKGYLMSLSSESMMMADGMLNTGDVSVAVTATDPGVNLPPNGHGTYNYSVEWRNINLIGNPYQSYLDFISFVEVNASELSEDDRKKCNYAVIDDSGNTGSKRPYKYYALTQSENYPYGASRYIHPHQGFFVKVSSDGTLKFTDAMRVAGTNTTLNSNYRGQVNYPLVNLLCYDEDGERDLTTVEVHRPEFGGGHKMEKLHDSKGLIYAHLENESFQTLFTPEGVNEVPVRFVAKEDGVFTLNWNTRHGNFVYLHLIDNMAGIDLDMLTNDEYSFEGKTTDYRSRFKLVFRCDDEDEDKPDDEGEDGDSDHFAFQFGDELIVNGEGLFQMFDLTGRCLMETQTAGAQSRFSIPKVAASVYLLRLTTGSKVKLQKMVINK